MAKVKKILDKEIKGFEFYKQLDHRVNRMRVHGIVWLRGGYMIHVRPDVFKEINDLGQVSGMVLKSNPGYKQIKRMIARWFQTYRTSRKSNFKDRVSMLREACQQAQYSLNIKVIQRGRISFNHYFTAS
ncbi:UNVERIFIED_CONTAM: hypothetical protein POZ17_19965 [Ralstonia mannitolilytica]